MGRVNDFLYFTRRDQMEMFGEHLPLMAIGGPDPASRHSSYAFYDLTEAMPDRYVCDAQDERDYREQTMTPKQKCNHEARMTDMTAALAARQASQPNTALQTLTSINRAKSTPTNNPPPAKSMPPLRPSEQQDCPAPATNTFPLTPLARCSTPRHAGTDRRNHTHTQRYHGPGHRR
jgi:hypothetical protein